MRADIKVEGIVQGVGFRPFCYRTATKFDLKGSVKNMGDAGVRIVLEGEEASIKKFLKVLKEDNPPTSRVEKVETDWSEETSGLQEFEILESDTEKSGRPSVVPPDTGLCKECYQEMMDPKDRRYHYPFITCVNCGPRFTIIEDLPYDRERTSMKEFPLCDYCQNEYQNPADRRYHAEPNCCPNQGPKMQLYKTYGSKISSSNPIEKAAEYLDAGKIVVVKGIGGMHVAAKTTDDIVLKELRKKFDRPEQPLAIMSRDIETTREFAKVDSKEEEILTSNRRPITLLEKRDESILSDLIAPGLDSLGVMLPYSGIHYLLFHHGKEPAYIMTSANLPGLPMVIENSEAISKLSEKVDYFLLHNRKIVSRCDDSVLRITGDTPTFLRRSRGYVPTPIETDSEKEISILALGPELDNTISISKGGRIFPSQYIGDVENVETLNFLKTTSQKFLDLFGIDEPDIIVSDLHPNFSTTELASDMAKEAGLEPKQIQHHKAHVYSLMAEHDLEELVCITADGAGYGEDGTVWGGEVIMVSPEGSERYGGLKKYPLPGGDLATKFPARALAGILWEENEAERIEHILKTYCKNWLREGESEVIIRQLQKNLNTPMASSTGRVLDSVSCVLGICGERTYEGEPAMKLESAAKSGRPEKADITVEIMEEEGRKVLDAGRLLSDVIDELENGTKRAHIAAAAQRGLAEGLTKIAADKAHKDGIKNVGVSGGVFYNDSITRDSHKIVDSEKLRHFQHEKVPPGDGGISLGQAYWAMKTF